MKTQNAQELSDYAARFRPGCWIFVRPGSKINRKHNRKPFRKLQSFDGTSKEYEEIQKSLSTSSNAQNIPVQWESLHAH